MITGYKIDFIRGEKVLILYLNYDTETGLDFFLSHKIGSIKEEINKYIKNYHISFNGHKIILSFGGIILATLLIIKDIRPENEMNFTYVSDSMMPSFTEIVDIKKDKNMAEVEILEEKINVSVVEEGKEELNLISPSKQEKVTKIINNDIQHNEIPNENSFSKEETLPDEKKEEEIKKEQIVTVYRSNGTVLNLPLEEYLIGVVGAEMPASFSKEALKAQAVVARTYALKKIEKKKKLTDTVSTQRYQDNEELRKVWKNDFNTYYQKIKSAVEETKGKAIYYQGNYIDCVYHSTSNGKTEDAKEVWKYSVPYLKSVDSSWDMDASSYIRTISKDLITVLEILGIDIDKNDTFEILSRNDSGRVTSIKIGNEIFTGVEFRNLLGLRSTDFDLELEDNTLTITTRGYGHGVGMSQYGANGMAKDGYTYEQILKHYYTGVSIY